MLHVGLIGDGRLARHLAHYFVLLGIPHRRWSRRLHAAQLTSWQQSLQECPTILLAISDGAINELAQEIRSTAGFENRTLIHFSGSLQTPHAWGFHPLMTFANAFYSLETYQRIPFLIEEGAPSLQDIFPRFQNPSARLSIEKKALYHAWCVMGGNFTAMLWGRMFETFSKELGLAPEIAIPYLRQLSENLLSHSHSPRSAWTGPVVRGDQKTIDANLKALRGDPYEGVYNAFLNAYAKERT